VRPVRASSGSGQIDLTLLGAPCRVAQGLEDIIALEVRVIDEEFIDGSSRADLADDYADGYA
jgi:hypothetical protein